MKKSWHEHYILDDQGNVLVEPDLFTWGDWMQKNPEKIHIAQDDVNGLRVSTIFLGLDFDITEESETPLVFETMVYRGDTILLQRRFDSMAYAKASHEIAVELARRNPAGSFENEGHA